MDDSDQYEEELLARAVARLEADLAADLAASHRLLLAFAARIVAQSDVITNLIQRRPAMHGTDLYRICPRCRGRGVIDTDRGVAACVSCAQRYVVAVNLSVEGIEELRRQNNDQREALYRAAQGCKRKEEEYGIPAVRTCRRCGLGPCELGLDPDTRTPLKT